MKKLIFTLLLSMFVNVVFSQTYLRAYSLTVGNVNEDKTISWENKKPTDPILIKFKEGKISIFSQVKQVYRIIGNQKLKKDYKLSFVQYDCIDERDKKCVVSVINLKESPNVFCIGVGYDDVTWFYEAKIEE